MSEERGVTNFSPTRSRVWEKHPTSTRVGNTTFSVRNATSLPTRQHRWQVAGQGDTQSLPTRPHSWQVADERDTHNPYLQDQTVGKSPVRETHAHNPYLQDHTDGKSPVKEAQTHTITAYKTAQMASHR